MRIAATHGSSLVELSLLIPLVAFLAVCFSWLGRLFVAQIRLENLAATLARDLAASAPPLPTSFDASACLVRAGFPDVETSLDIRLLPALPRPFPRNTGPLRVVSLTLRQPFRGAPVLSAHAREVLP